MLGIFTLSLSHTHTHTHFSNSFSLSLLCNVVSPQFFSRYNSLMQFDNYVTKRQSIKLLGEVLLDRSNFDVMMRYIGEKANLKVLMMLLRDSSKSIQIEAFHVFKVFVANPNKTDEVVEILHANKDKLIHFLSNFKTEKGA